MESRRVRRSLRQGARPRGLTLAIFLTYTAIVSSYVPFIIQEVREHSAQVTKATPPTTTASTSTGSTTASKIGPLGFVIGIVVLLAVLYATPFLAGIQNLIGVLIIGFALYEAWKLNRRAELKVSGPHRVSMSGAPA